MQVEDVFFKKEAESQAGDYSLFISSGAHNPGREALSSDPEEAKWDHFREENLLHVFHTLLHKVFDASVKSGVPRVFELFFYTHQQLMRRANLERAVAGLKEITPLDPRAIRQSLGPGYRAGW